jgi:hypothetical protein
LLGAYLPDIALPKGTFAQKNEQGLIEILDEKTGAIVAIQSSVIRGQEIGLKEICLKDGSKVLVDEQIDPETLKVISTKKYVFNADVASIICQKITEGNGFGDICKEPGMPPFFILSKWRKMYKDFDDAIEQALRDQAYYFRDMAIEQVLLAKTKNGDTDHKAISDAYFKAAEKGNRDRFGHQTKLTAEPGTLAVAYYTGVPKAPEVEEKPAEVKDVN